jgi:2,4-dienoyl-CoA reductase-like NADH-dependent reductase (Old Yellow Enzyme family)
MLRETVRQARARCGAGFAIGVRLSLEDFGQARGLDLDESVQVAAWLADDGVDYVHLSLWDGKRMTTKRPAEHALPIFRRAVPAEVRLIAAGKVWTRDDAEALVALGADLVAVGRAAIVDPDWPRHVLAEGAAPRRPPLTPDEYQAVAVGPRFVNYLRGFKDMVAAT